jgi:predicted RNA-binding Zn ribbon-like protein
MPQAGTPEPRFSLSGGHLCLDFANTLDNRLTGRAKELLTSYADLVAWSRQVDLLTEADAQRLKQEGAQRPADAAAVLQRAITLREAIYRIFSAAAAGRVSEAADLDTLNQTLAQGRALRQVVVTAKGYRWQWQAQAAALDRMLWPVAQAAAALLTSEDAGAVRECAAGDCGWLFLDLSHRRRWCSMQACGNRMKARRHYTRHKTGG